MSEAVVVAAEAEVVEEQGEHHLVALNQPQLERAHAQMLAWCAAKQKEVRAELRTEQANLDVAVARKWKQSPFITRINLLKRRVTFYEKITQALQAGFVIVPNFEMDVFAIRTKASAPKGSMTNESWNRRFIQPAQLLAQGEGQYRSPDPLVMQETQTETGKDGKEKQVTYYWPTEFTDVDFPMALARPEIMNRAGEVMALKLFDTIGIAAGQTGQNTRRSGDPILLGRLINPRKYAQPVTFFLGWYFDPSAL